MSVFDYSDDEMAINKVLKMNQNISNTILSDQDLIDSRKQADENINKSLELLHSLEKPIPTRNTTHQSQLHQQPKVEKWDNLVEQANKEIPYDISLENILSQSEIKAAFDDLDTINNIFSQKTSIVNKVDLSFLTISTALQVTKSLLFNYFAQRNDYGNSFAPKSRLNHNDITIKKSHQKANYNFIKKHIGNWISILYEPVPYDITEGSKDIGVNMGGKYHRLYTLGHDPILGWIFGTANILTDCITLNNFQTYRISRIDPITGTKRPHITPEIIPMEIMFHECYNTIKDDYLNLPAAIFSQAQHLKSDEFTKLGLPVPILTTLDENFASELYRKNYDTKCFARDVTIVGSSLSVSALIDMIIILTHRLFKKESESTDLFEIRTRKILLLSNTIASSSTIINTAISKKLQKLDIGGLLNTISHFFTDIRFITKLKQEFIENEISNQLKTELYEVDKLYNI